MHIFVHSLHFFNTKTYRYTCNQTPIVVRKVHQGTQSPMLRVWWVVVVGMVTWGVGVAVAYTRIDSDFLRSQVKSPKSLVCNGTVLWTRHMFAKTTWWYLPSWHIYFFGVYSMFLSLWHQVFDMSKCISYNILNLGNMKCFFYVN